MNLSFERHNTAYTIHLDGELDEYTARTIRADVDRLIEQIDIKSLTFDMAGVTFVDSTGLGFVLGRYKKLRAKRAELLLKNVAPQVDKVFKASGVYNFVPKV